MTRATEITDTLHHQFTLGNCDERELALLADFDVPGAEMALTCRLAAQRLLQIKAEEKQKRANKAAGRV